MTMATRIGVLERGRLHQVGSAQELYTRPRNRFVAEFMGAMNWVPARAKPARTGEPLLLETPLGTFQASLPPPSSDPEREFTMGFRPSAANVSAGEGSNRIGCEILETQYVGSHQQLTVLARGTGDARAQFRFKIMEPNPLQIRRPGDRIEIRVAPEQIMVL